MKNALLTLALVALATSVAMAQSFKVDPETKSMYDTRPAYMIDTVATSGLDKKQLYSNSLSFIAATFEDSRDVIQIKDLELGEIMFNGYISRQYTDTVDHKTQKTRQLASILHYKCKLYLKDGKYKVVLYNLDAGNSNFPEYKYTLDVPILSGSKEEKRFNTVSRELALVLIKDITAALNKSPNNEF